MTSAFPRTLRSLDTDRRTAPWLVATALLALGGWLAWAFAARVTLVEVSRSARVEAAPLPSRLQAPVAALVIARKAKLGARVAAGDVLFQLDTSALASELAGQMRLQASLPKQLAAIAREVDVVEGLVCKRAVVAQAEADEARALRREQAARNGLATREKTRLEKLSAQGVASDLELARAQARAHESAAAAEALEARAKKILEVASFERGEHEVQLSRLARDAAELHSDGLRIAAVIAKLEAEIARRTIRAPQEGVLVAVADIDEGAVVTPGQALATIVPDGRLRVVAELGSDAAARARVGQRARLEVAGFPWTQFGTVPCTVSGVSGELSVEGTLQVVLTIEAGSLVPLRHGHSGTVEIEVERISPAVLALRAAGLLTNGARR